MSNGKERVSSQEISEALRLDATTVRKDFATLGEFGRRGYGYDVAYLKQFIAQLLYHDHPIRTVFVGSVHFYQVLQDSRLMVDEGYQVTAIFTPSAEELSTGQNGLPVFLIHDLDSFVATHAVDIAILSAAKEAQHVAEMVVQAGITAILNCTGQYIQLPGDIYVHHMDILGELQALHWRRIYEQGSLKA